jgi:hypothetical protein
MSNVTIPKRMTEEQFYTDLQAAAAVQGVARIRSRFGTFINQAALLTNVPEPIITSFIYIESGGDPDVDTGAIGLMQIDHISASEGIYLEHRAKRLTEAEQQALRRFMGSRLDCILKQKSRGQKQACNNMSGVSVTRKELYNPEFNILVGSIYVSLLISESIENGLLRLDKVIARYNRRYDVKPKGVTADEVIAESPSVTKAYIKKFVGRNGLLELIA